MVPLDQHSKGSQMIHGHTGSSRLVVWAVASCSWISFAVQLVSLEFWVELTQVMAQASVVRDIRGLKRCPELSSEGGDSPQVVDETMPISLVISRVCEAFRHTVKGSANFRSSVQSQGW